MTSTKPLAPSRSQRQRMNWPAVPLRYFSCGYYLRQVFGTRVQKVSVDAGFTCPNVDGTVAVGGCTFCDNRSFSPSRRLPRLSIAEQIDEGIRRLRRRYDCHQFLAYFQPATNTYAPVDRLAQLYESALQHPQIVGLVIGTRPDCVPEPVVELLERLARRTFLVIEYGMQSMFDRSLDWMNRGHRHRDFLEAVQRSRGRGFEIGAHVILGIPGETRAEMLATADELARVEIDSVKIHNLYVVRGTRLADQYAAGEVRLMDRDEFVATLVDFLERLPPDVVVERLSGDAPDDFLVAPDWCRDKPGFLRRVEQEFQRRGSCQGARHWYS